MLATSFACPECRAVLKTATPVPAGKKVKCPKCSKIFTTPGEESAPASPIQERKKVAAPPAPRKEVVMDDEPADDYGEARARGRAPARPSMPASMPIDDEG